MFGLDNISYWQFAKTVMLVLFIYYVSVMIYLYRRGRSKQRPLHFEEETEHNKQEPIQQVKAAELPSKKINTSESGPDDLKAFWDEEEDRSGMELESLNDSEMQDKRAFQDHIQYVIKHPVAKSS